jgi:hypothetical protein
VSKLDIDLSLEKTSSTRVIVVVVVDEEARARVGLRARARFWKGNAFFSALGSGEKWLLSNTRSSFTLRRMLVSGVRKEEGSRGAMREHIDHYISVVDEREVGKRIVDDVEDDVDKDITSNFLSR